MGVFSPLQPFTSSPDSEPNMVPQLQEKGRWGPSRASQYSLLLWMSAPWSHRAQQPARHRWDLSPLHILSRWTNSVRRQLYPPHPYLSQPLDLPQLHESRICPSYWQQKQAHKAMGHFTMFNNLLAHSRDSGYISREIGGLYKSPQQFYSNLFRGDS